MLNLIICGKFTIFMELELSGVKSFSFAAFKKAKA